MAVNSRVDVAVDVVPAVGAPLVTEAAVELDASSPAPVLDVSHGAGGNALATGAGECVRSLDVSAYTPGWIRAHSPATEQSFDVRIGATDAYDLPARHHAVLPAQHL